jgi:DNA-binding GntR family transcriptional regulator
MAAPRHGALRHGARTPLESRPGRLPQTLAELDAIVAAIEQGDAEKAARLSAEHVQKAGQGVLRAMDGKATPAR